jgi:hypothetical protein
MARIGRVAIAFLSKHGKLYTADSDLNLLTLDKLGDTLTDNRDTLAVRIGADGTYFTEKFFYARYDILREYIWSQVHESGPLRKSGNLDDAFDYEGQCDVLDHDSPA